MRQKDVKIDRYMGVGGGCLKRRNGLIGVWFKYCENLGVSIRPMTWNVINNGLQSVFDLMNQHRSRMTVTFYKWLPSIVVKGTPSLRERRGFLSRGPTYTRVTGSTTQYLIGHVLNYLSMLSVGGCLSYCLSVSLSCLPPSYIKCKVSGHSTYSRKPTDVPVSFDWIEILPA